MAQLVRGDHVLVLGASGFIGGHLVELLVAQGVTVTNFDLFAPSRPLPEGVETIVGDVRDVDALRDAAQGATAIINLAAAHHDFGIPTDVFEAVNVDGARNVCQVADEAGITNLCFYSSVAVYGSAGDAPDETSVPEPENDYGRTKLAAETVYARWRDAGPGRRMLVIRPAVVFGPHHFANVYRLVRQIDRRRFWPVGAGTNRKSMCAVENLVAATYALWSAPAAREDEVYNYADKPDLRSHEVVETIYRTLGRRAPRPHVPEGLAVALAKPFDVLGRLLGRDLPITSARIRKLSSAETMFTADRVRETGFVAEVSLTEALERMVRWYKAEGEQLEPAVHIPGRWDGP
ncbi:MAG: NAD-dependent epimerase/dehydratase family protein [Actinomycetales bacterium]|nr:NAD-dependent epimerase/dehydratase family protein [Actinomycetales bacterium]